MVEAAQVEEEERELEVSVWEGAEVPLGCGATITEVGQKVKEKATGREKKRKTMVCNGILVEDEAEGVGTSSQRWPLLTPAIGTPLTLACVSSPPSYDSKRVIRLRLDNCESSIMIFLAGKEGASQTFDNMVIWSTY